MENIIQTLNKFDLFKTLIKFISLADIATMLDIEGPFTLFAPIDEAFAEVPQEIIQTWLNDKKQLIEMLENHLVLGEMTTNDLKENPLLQTLSGNKILLDILDDTFTLDGASIIQPDISYVGGQIHIIDSVLLPEKE